MLEVSKAPSVFTVELARGAWACGGNVSQSTHAGVVKRNSNTTPAAMPVSFLTTGLSSAELRRVGIRVIFVRMETCSFDPPQSELGALRILLVEDSKALANRLEEEIQRISGINVIGATDSEAVAISIACRDVDVMILDLHLKHGTGFGVMRALGTSKHRPIIIVYSNFDSQEYKTAALAYGADHFLDKAHDFARLPKLLAQIRDQRLIVNQR